MRIGRLNAETFHLKLHRSANGPVVGYMGREDEFLLADGPPVRNFGGKIDWQCGTVTTKGTTYRDVYVAHNRLDIVETLSPPDVEPLPPPQPDVLGAQIPTPEVRVWWWPFRSWFRSWTELPGILIAIMLAASLGYCVLH